MDVILSEFLVQALRQSAQTELARCESARGGIAPQRRSCTREYQRATLADLIELISLESRDGKAREREGGTDVRVQRLGDFFICNLQERLPDTMTGVPDCDTQN